MYLEKLRAKLNKLATKAPAIPKAMKVPGTSSASTPSPKVNIAKPPKLKMPSMTAPPTPKLPGPKLPSPASTLDAAPSFDLQELMKKMFNGTASTGLV